MRLVTFSRGEGNRLGAVVGDNVFDLARADLPSDMIAFLEAGEAAWERARVAAREAECGVGGLIPLAQVTLLAPIPRPRKNVFALGLNYSEHVAEGARARGVWTKMGITVAPRPRAA